MICQKFICNVFGIGVKRIKTVQKKIKSGETMEDKRGRHMNQKVKLTDDLKTLIQVHYKSIPHSESHYSRENSKLNYFYDRSLTLSELYLLFLDFYTAVTGNESIPIDKTTYYNYFNHHVNFSFDLPQTDVCDNCYAYESSKRGKN